MFDIKLPKNPITSIIPKNPITDLIPDPIDNFNNNLNLVNNIGGGALNEVKNLGGGAVDIVKDLGKNLKDTLDNAIPDFDLTKIAIIGGIALVGLVVVNKMINK